MTSKTKRIAMFAIATVAIGAAVLTSCGKDDESLTNETEMVQKLSDPTVGNSTTVDAGFIMKYWQKLPDGTRDCFTGPERSEPCSVVLTASKNDPSIPVSIKIGFDGIIKSLSINNTDISNEDKPVFDKCVLVGKISFASDSPIEDPKLQAIVANDYIEAGVYPIHKVDNTYIITISE